MLVDENMAFKAMVKVLAERGLVTDPLEVVDLLEAFGASLRALSPPSARVGPREPAASDSAPAPSAPFRAEAGGDTGTPPGPAVPIERSVTPDYLICLEDGERVVLLRPHLKRKFNMTPDQYIVKWGLPPDYPMAAPNYALRKALLAKVLGFGLSHREGHRERFEAIREKIRRARHLSIEELKRYAAEVDRLRAEVGANGSDARG